ncbi:MAG: hypothetical protein ABSE20_12870 [Acetobacteraceae bacterium]
MPNFERARESVRKLVKEKAAVDRLEVALQVADIIGGVVDAADNLGGLASFGFLTGSLSLIKQITDSDDASVLPNINFVYNGQEDGDSPMTAEYFRGRALKNIGGSAFSLIGVAASTQTAGINVASVVQHANASGTTAVHLLQLLSMANRERKMQRVTIGDWLKVVILAKSLKQTIRGASLVGAVIPAASLGVGIGTCVAKVGIKMTLSKVCFATAAEIHWRAFQEQAISKGLNGGNGRLVGPASEIYWEIFTKRGLTRIFGNYNIAGLVSEPAGWLPLADKLMLI